jgi:hypothetical protein
MLTQPQNVPDQPRGVSKEQLERAAIDPYFLWTGLEPEDTLPYATVRDGLARFIAAQFRVWWDIWTPPKASQHLARDEGLRLWSVHESEQRLKLHLLAAYSAADFHALHFSEEILDGGNLNDPEWKPLIEHKLGIKDRVFFERIGLLMGKEGNWQHRAQMFFCMAWDRLIVPLEFWTVPAATVFLREALLANRISIAGVTEASLSQWIRRLGLVRAMPPVVVKYWNKGRQPRIDYEAARKHGLKIECDWG